MLSNIFYFFAWTASYIVKKCVYMQIPDCVETVYVLPFPPNNTAREIFNEICEE